MKGKPQRVISHECKHEAVPLVLTSGKSATQIAKDLGVSDSALSRWIRESRAQCSQAKDICRSADEEMRRLKRENDV